MLLYWPHPSALVAYNGGTNVGHGPVRTLFPEPDFVPSTGTLDVGHGPARTLFLGLILCFVPLTPCETMLYCMLLHWPHRSALVAYNGGTNVGHGLIRTLFLEPDFVPGTLDVGHGLVWTPFLGLILCLVPMTRCETMLYCVLLCWPHPSALVAYNGGTNVGHGLIRTLFLEPDFVPGTLDVGHGPARTLFLGLILCLVPMTRCETMLYCVLLYWPHPSALVAYNGGTNVGHGLIRTLFLEPDFVPGTLDVGHGLVWTPFLGLILCLVPMTRCETMLYCVLLCWPHPSALVAYNGGTNVGHGLIRTLFLEPDFVPGTLDVGHGPARTPFLGLILCLVPMTRYETMLYCVLLCWPHPSALVAYNGGTNVGHGLIRTLFLEPDFVPGTLDVGHGPARTPFLGLILCLVPMTRYETMLYCVLLCWPHPSALVAYNGGTNVGHGLIRTLFLEPDFVPGTLDIGHAPVRTPFLGLILCLVPTTPCDTML